MADPVSWFMIAASAGSSLMQNVSAYQQGQAESSAAGANAQIARDNAARARLDAGMAEEAQRREARKVLGRMAAAGSQSGAAGGGPGQGSFGAVINQSSKEAELDALNIRYGGETEAGASLTQAAQFDMERKAAKQRAKMGLITGVMGAASAGLSGYSNYRVQSAGRAYGSPSPMSRPKVGGAKPRPGRAPLIKAYGSY